MPDPRLPPSRFGVGHTVGGPPMPAPLQQASRTAPSSPHPPSPTPVGAASGPTNKLALLAFITVVGLGPLAAPVAIPAAVFAGRQCTQMGQRGAGLARAAVFIGVAYLALVAVVLVLALLPMT